jgi:hypothetical protein
MYEVRKYTTFRMEQKMEIIVEKATDKIRDNRKRKED